MAYPANGLPNIVLFTEDCKSDQEFIKKAFNGLDEFKSKASTVIVETGLPATDYRKNKGEYSEYKSKPRLDLIILDINLPLFDGENVLKDIKQDIVLSSIPVIMFTMSENERNIIDCYSLGANAYLVKPDDIDDYIWMIQSTGFYWLFLTRLPANKGYKSNIDLN